LLTRNYGQTGTDCVQFAVRLRVLCALCGESSSALSVSSVADSRCGASLSSVSSRCEARFSSICSRCGASLSSVSSRCEARFSSICSRCGASLSSVSSRCEARSLRTLRSLRLCGESWAARRDRLGDSQQRETSLGVGRSMLGSRLASRQRTTQDKADSSA